MRIGFELVLLLIGLLPYCFCDIIFFDCGSDHIDIHTISITGCESSLCSLQRGQAYNISIIPEFLDPKIDHVNLDVRAMIRGALFDVDAHFVEPCGLPCPIRNKVLSPNIPITVKLSSSLIRGIAPLYVSATYLDGTTEKSHFCVRFYVFIN